MSESSGTSTYQVTVVSTVTVDASDFQKAADLSRGIVKGTVHGRIDSVVTTEVKVL